jgi:hypothetical protein
MEKPRLGERGFRTGYRAALRGALAAAACLAAGGFAFGQGSLEGTVTTPEGTPLPGICCIFLNQKDLPKPIGPQQTRPDGTYRFPNVAPGLYVIEVRVPGFAEMNIPGIRVLATERTKYDIKLAVETGEEVRVIEQQKVVQVTSKQTTTFSPEMVEGLPSIGNTFQAIVAQTAGVAITDSGEIVIRGAKATETQVRLSNMNLSDPFGAFGTNPVDISTDAIEEIQVTTGGFDASQFGFQGGQVRLIPKEGKNEREGSVGLNYRSSLFDRYGARGWIRPSTSEFTVYEPTMTFGGPFIRDQFWYFTNLVYNDQQFPRLKQKAVSGEYESLTYESSGWRTILIRNTYQLNAKNKLSLLYQGVDLETSFFANFFDAWRGIFLPPDSDVREANQVHGFEFKIDSVLGTNTNLESTFVFINVGLDWSQIRPVHDTRVIPCSKFESTAGPEQFIVCDGDETSGPYPDTFDYGRKSFQWEERFTSFLDNKFGGTHRFSFGFRGEYFTQEYNFFAKPIITFEFREQPDDPQRVSASFAYNQPRDDTTQILGIYFQDDLTVSRRWNVGVGLTYFDQRYTTFGYKGRDTYDDLCRANPECGVFGAVFEAIERDAAAMNANCLNADHLLSTDSDAYWNTDSTNGPRCWSLPPTSYGDIGITSVRFLVPGLLNYLAEAEPIKFGGTTLTASTSVIWQPFGDDDTIVTAFLSRYYGILGYTTAWETSEKIVQGSFEESDPNSSTPPTGCDFATSIESADCYGRADYYLFDRNMKIPYTDEWSMTVQRNLTPVLGVKAIYTSRRSFQQPFVKNINLTKNESGEITGLKNKNFRSIFYLTNLEDRRYESFEFHIEKNLTRGWELKTNYTYAKAEGVAEDVGDFLSNDPRFTLIPETGFIDDDQRHLINVSLLNYFPGQFRLGTILRWESGLPYSTAYRVTDPLLGNIETYFGQGKNAYRSPAHWRVDMNLNKDFRFEKGSGSVSLEMRNLLNKAFIGDQAAVINSSGSRGGGGAGGGGGSISGPGAFGGTSTAAFLPGFDFGRSWEFSFKYRF